jgi:hypothetical protein
MEANTNARTAFGVERRDVAFRRSSWGDEMAKATRLRTFGRRRKCFCPGTLTNSGLDLPDVVGAAEHRIAAMAPCLSGSKNT